MLQEARSSSRPCGSFIRFLSGLHLPQPRAYTSAGRPGLRQRDHFRLQQFLVACEQRNLLNDACRSNDFIGWVGLNVETSACHRNVPCEREYRDASQKSDELNAGEVQCQSLQLNELGKLPPVEKMSPLI